MTQLSQLLLATLLIVFTLAALAKDQPIQHKVVPDVTNLEDAKAVFADTTEALSLTTELDAQALHNIHMITYSLEKAIAYFAENLQGEQKASAQGLAEVVERVHLASENNRRDATRTHLEEYFKLAEEFSEKL